MLFLLYRVSPQDRNASGVHACVVDAATEQDARDSAKAAVPNGGTKVRDTWACLPLGNGAIPPELRRKILWFEGDCISMRGMSRSGSPV